MSEEMSKKIEQLEQKIKSLEIQKAASLVKTAPEAARIIQNTLAFYDNKSNELVDAKGKKYYIPPLPKDTPPEIHEYLKEQMKDIYSRK